MNSNQIRCMLSNDKKTRQNFIDVMALDEFKNFVKKNTLMKGLYVVTVMIRDHQENIGF